MYIYTCVCVKNQPERNLIRTYRSTYIQSTHQNIVVSNLVAFGSLGLQTRKKTETQITLASRFALFFFFQTLSQDCLQLGA